MSLINHYDRAKIEIDIDAQLTLLKLTDQKEKDELLAVNIQLINEYD